MNCEDLLVLFLLWLIHVWIYEVKISKNLSARCYCSCETTMMHILLFERREYWKYIQVLVSNVWRSQRKHNVMCTKWHVIQYQPKHHLSCATSSSSLCSVFSPSFVLLCFLSLPVTPKTEYTKEPQNQLLTCIEYLYTHIHISLYHINIIIIYNPPVLRFTCIWICCTHIIMRQNEIEKESEGAVATIMA